MKFSTFENVVFGPQKHVFKIDPFFYVTILDPKSGTEKPSQNPSTFVKSWKKYPRNPKNGPKPQKTDPPDPRGPRTPGPPKSRENEGAKTRFWGPRTLKKSGKRGGSGGGQKPGFRGGFFPKNGGFLPQNP